MIGPFTPQGFGHFQREADAILESAAVSVVPPVRERRIEAVQQIAVGGV